MCLQDLWIRNHSLISSTRVPLGAAGSQIVVPANGNRIALMFTMLQGTQATTYLQARSTPQAGDIGMVPGTSFAQVPTHVPFAFVECEWWITWTTNPTVILVTERIMDRPLEKLLALYNKEMKGK